MSSKFDLLPARPPTPPREISTAVDDALSFLADCDEVDRLLSKSHTAKDTHTVLRTESSPASSRVTETTSSASKKVDFSPHTTCYNPPDTEQMNFPHTKSPKKSPIPKTTKPLRSILKSTDGLAPPTPEDLSSKLSSFSPQVPGSFAKMLQSVIHQLAGPTRVLRLDAYLALNGVLRTYDNVPDVQSMSQKMVPITQFLTRDLAWKDPEGNLDVNIITQALKLTTAILFNSKLAQALDEDFEAFVVDRSLAVLEQPDIPKAIIKAHMYLLAQQRFNSQVMTAAKVDKLTTVLQTIEERCTGNSVTGSRLAVYQRLFAQAPGVMLTRIRDWLEHLFHGMLSSVQVVQAKAIEVSTQAALRFGQQPLASKALRELFETEVEEGQTYCDFLTLRLSEMMADKDTAATVPPIWASIVLFFRSKRMPLERWPTFKSWLLIIQRCFNSSDPTVRYHAHLAWNKLVFAIMPDASTSKNLMSMLRIPITAGMEKPGSDKFSQQIRLHAADSYYNLLHYAFRPGLSNEEYDCAWDTFVDPLLFTTAKFDGAKGRKKSMRVLYGLINGNAGVWKIDAAPEQIALKPEDLPKLDPRWIRSRLGKVLKLLEPRLLADMWHFVEPGASIDVVWQALMHSVADAGSQEVRTSNELKQAIALLVNVFHRQWNGCKLQQTANNGTIWLERYISLLEKMVGLVGTASLVEDILLRTKDDVIEVAPTPSHRHAKDHSTPQSPLVIMLGQFFHPPGELTIDLAYENAALTVLKMATASKPSFQSKLELLTRTQRLCSQGNTDVSNPLANERLWTAFATSTVLILEPELPSASEQQSQSLGLSLLHALDILTTGLALSSGDQSHQTMKELYDAIHECAKAWAGDGGVVLALMEPFAKSLVTCTTSNVLLNKRLDLACHMLKTASWPKTRQSMEQARKSLWGVGLGPNRVAVFDPFEHVYALIQDLAVSLYGKPDDSSSPNLDLTQQLFSSVIEFLERCPTSIVGPALRKTQDAFALWIVDKSRKTGAIETYHELVSNAWTRIIKLVDELPTKDTNLLNALENLLVAGFSSPYRAVVNTTIVFWNESFGKEETLSYPPSLESVLRARAVDADIVLPDFPNDEDEDPPLSLPAFYHSESQTTIQSSLPKSLGNVRRDLHPTASEPSAQSPYFAALRSPLRQHTSASSPAKKAVRSSAGSTPKPRLRHDDSQIQFAPIDSSPLVPENESQLLTEHQKEVKARQFQDAQLFPNLSSSPLAKSTAVQRVVPKRLNFTSSNDEQQKSKDPGTPVGLPDGHGLMSDDLPSSPTPSAKGADQLVARGDEDEEIEDVPEEPPSSPPRATVDVDDAPALPKEADTEMPPVETTVPVTASEVEALVVSSRSPSPERNQELDAADNMNSDLPSDTDLPTMQLQQEEEEAIEGREKSSNSAAGGAEAQKATLAEVPRSDKTIDPSRVVDSITTEAEGSPQDVPDQAQEDEVTTVEDSFYGPGAHCGKAEVQPASQSQQSQGSPQSQRAGRKRKRSKAVLFTTKKRRQQSPLVRITPGSFNQDDEDIGEEIVVASSQRSSSPARQFSSEAASSLVSSPIVKSETAPQSTVLPGGETDTTATQAPPKRGRGRPRKSATPVPSPAEQAPAKSLKRKASTLSISASPEVQVFSSFVEATPPAKASKQSNGDTARANGASQEQTNAADQVRESGGVANDPTTPEKQLQAEQASTTANRPIATPRSMLKRLRDALTDFKGMIMGSQEEREFDDVLFEFRKEVHDAARRGIM